MRQNDIVSWYRCGTLRLFIYVMILGAGLLTPDPVLAETSVVRIKVTGMTTMTGSLRARLDGSEESFKNDAPPVQSNEQAVVGKEMELIFRDVPPGIYAVKIIHDEDDDKELNTNLLGIPSEKYGISNNVKGKFGLPGFKDASFVVGSGEVTLRIVVEHHSFF